MSRDERRDAEQATAPETAASVLPGLPRLAALDALLREVDGLRMTLETDLTLAAAAAESGATALVDELVGADLEQLHGFEARALGHLDTLAAAERAHPACCAAAAPAPAPVTVLRPRRRLRPALAPLVGAAAALVAVLGFVPSATSASPSDRVTAMSSWDQLTRLAGSDAPAGEVRTAALQWHREVAALVRRAGSDPVAARQALVLLQAEQQVLADDEDAATLQGVLAQSRALADQILAALPAQARGTVHTVLSAVPHVVVPTTAPQPRPDRTARPRHAEKTPAPPTASPAPPPQPQPSASPSTAAPSPTPVPSPTQTDPLHLNGAKDGLGVATR